MEGSLKFGRETLQNPTYTESKKTTTPPAAEKKTVSSEAPSDLIDADPSLTIDDMMPEKDIVIPISTLGIPYTDAAGNKVWDRFYGKQAEGKARTQAEDNLEPKDRRMGRLIIGTFPDFEFNETMEMPAVTDEAIAAYNAQQNAIQHPPVLGPQRKKRSPLKRFFGQITDRFKGKKAA